MNSINRPPVLGTRREAIQILAHRGNTVGPQSESEGSFRALSHALDLGFGLEIDLRRHEDGFYLSHDPLTEIGDESLSSLTCLFDRHPDNVIAVNVKELDYAADLIDLDSRQVFGRRAFYFDFELLEPDAPGATQRRIRQLPGGEQLNLAARISDRNESVGSCLSIPAETVWADEFDSNWLTADVLQQVKQAGREVYVVSPELHGAQTADRMLRWEEILSWPIDGICTDYAVEADTFFNGVKHGRLSA